MKHPVFDYIRRFRKPMQFLITFAIVAFLLYSLYSTWNEISAQEFSINYTLMLASYPLLFLSYLATNYGWWVILRGIGCDVKFRDSIRAWFYSQLGKYMPGKVWFVVGRIYLLREHTTKSKITFSVFLEVIMLLLSGSIIMTIVSLFNPSGTSALGFYNTLVLLSIPIALAVLHPKVLCRVMRAAPKKLGLHECSPVGYGKMLKTLLIYMFTWVLTGLGFFLFLMSLGAAGTVGVPHSIFIFTASWLIGFISFITPGGIGIREGVMALLLAQFMPMPLAVLVSLVSRIWLMVAEFAPMAAIDAFSRKRQTQRNTSL